MPEKKTSTGWVGWVYFAATMLLVTGGINMIAGLTGIFNPGFYVQTQSGNVLLFDYAAWGWAHLVLGLAVLAVGVFLIRGRLWAQAVTVGLVALLTVVNLAFIGTYPLWSIISVIINGMVIYAITLHGDELRLIRQ